MHGVTIKIIDKSMSAIHTARTKYFGKNKKKSALVSRVYSIWALSRIRNTYGVFQSTVKALRATNDVYRTVNKAIPLLLYYSVYDNHLHVNHALLNLLIGVFTYFK